MNLAEGVPVRAAVRATAAVAPFLAIEHAVAVEQSQRKPLAGDTQNFLQRPLRVRNETKRGDRDDKVETCIGKRKLTRVARNVNFIRAAMRPSVMEPLAIRIEAGHVQAGIPGEAACEISGAATDVEQRGAWRRREHMVQ